MTAATFPGKGDSRRKKAFSFLGKNVNRGVQAAVQKKKGINSTGSRSCHPLPDRTASGSMRPLGTRLPALLSTRHQWRVRFSCTAAFDRRRRKAPSFTNSRPPCLCLGRNWNPAPGIQYIIKPRRVNEEKRPEQHFPRHKRVFSLHGQVCCTRFVLPCRDSVHFELRIGIRFLFPEK